MSNSQSLSVASLITRIKTQQAHLGLSNQELCSAVGFENEGALALILQGAMRLPLTRVPAFASALGLDVSELFKVALHEADPALSRIIGEVFNALNLTSTEVNLIKHQREVNKGREAAPATTALSFREKTQRLTGLPVKDIFKIQMKDLELKNSDLQKALGFATPNLISMIKTGSMQLPASKAIIAANTLEIDPVFLLGKVIAENDPALWDAITALLAEKLITANELSLIEYVRDALDGHDMNLTGSQEFMSATEPAIKVVRERQHELAKAAIIRSSN